MGGEQATGGILGVTRRLGQIRKSSGGTLPMITNIKKRPLPKRRRGVTNTKHGNERGLLWNNELCTHTSRSAITK